MYGCQLTKAISYFFHFIDVFLVEGLVALVTGLFKGLEEQAPSAKRTDSNLWRGRLYRSGCVVIYALQGGT